MGNKTKRCGFSLRRGSSSNSPFSSLSLCAVLTIFLTVNSKSSLSLPLWEEEEDDDDDDERSADDGIGGMEDTETGEVLSRSC